MPTAVKIKWYWIRIDPADKWKAIEAKLKREQGQHEETTEEREAREKAEREANGRTGGTSHFFGAGLSLATQPCAWWFGHWSPTTTTLYVPGAGSLSPSLRPPLLVSRAPIFVASVQPDERLSTSLPAASSRTRAARARSRARTCTPSR